MVDTAALCVELRDTWHREIPLSAVMGIGIDRYEEDTLVVRAPLSPNRNVHGTAFAGSLFSVCVLTGWGATWLALRRRGLSGTIVVADSQVRYRKPVTGDLVCVCTAAAATVADALEPFASTGRASLPLVATIDSGDKRAVTFTGHYVVHAARHG